MHTVFRNVLPAVLIGPVVYVHRIDVHGPALCGHDGEHARTASHIETGKPRQVTLHQFGRHEPRRGMVPRTERHLGHDDDIQSLYGRGRKGGADGTDTVHLHRFEIGLPESVPVLRLYLDIGRTRYSETGQHPVRLLLAPVERLLRNISLQYTGLFGETLEGKIGQHGRNYLCLPGIRHGHVQLDIIHTA